MRDLDGVPRQRRPVGVIGSVVRNTPELVKPRQHRGPRVPRRGRADRARVGASCAAGREGAGRGHPRGRGAGANRVDGNPAAPWQGPIIGIVDKLQNTTVDLVIAGHTHRAANTVVGRIPVVEGFNAGVSYSVAQLMVRRWRRRLGRRRDAHGQEPRRRPARRREGDRRQGQRRHRPAAQRGDRHADRRHPARQPRAPARVGDGQPRRRRDARQVRRDVVQAAITNSGGLRQDFLLAPPSAGEQPGEITWGEVFAVLPFGNATVIETLTDEQLVPRWRTASARRAANVGRHRPHAAGTRACGSSSTATARRR